MIIKSIKDLTLENMIIDQKYMVKFRLMLQDIKIQGMTQWCPEWYITIENKLFSFSGIGCEVCLHFFPKEDDKFLDCPCLRVSKDRTLKFLQTIVDNNGGKK